ncbi:hypothetical protein GCM10009754_34160 [Amycolatopsis minnesotensis]|uniref:Uncharacterized protein n=1 Tax=Amycolatopsis minnesotensis TaxID=337894 RepID=A0ABN2QZC0_9PSEU
MIERDLRLLDRLRDLQSSLIQDVGWLVESQCDGAPRADGLRDLQSSLIQDVGWLVESQCDGAPRADGLRDLGERLADLSTVLLARADELDAAALAKLPPDRWIPAADTAPREPGLAHCVGERPLRCGLVYLALCGAACFPLYGKDPARRIDRHTRCGQCLYWST